MSLLSLAVEKVIPKLTIAKRLLKEQLEEDGIRVRLSTGCLTEFARIASAAAARTTEKPDSPYVVRLRREIDNLSRFIRAWTDSDESFDSTRSSELVMIARRYALPRPWRLSQPVSAVQRQSIAAQIPAHLIVKRQ